MGDRFAPSKSNVCPYAPVSKDRFQTLLATSWGRVWPKVGKGTMADKMDSNTKTIDRAVTGSNLPEAHTVFNSLLAHPTALDEVLTAYGFRLAPLHADAANDFHTASELARAAGTFIDALSDGRRCHNETLALGAIFRDLLPKISAIVGEADQIRTGKVA